MTLARRDLEGGGRVMTLARRDLEGGGRVMTLSRGNPKAVDES
jgi:hypothetical protein